MLRNAAIDHEFPVALFSLEMASLQLVNRLIAAEAELESEKIKKGTLAEHEWQQLLHKTSKLSQAPIYIDDTPALSIFELRTKSRRLKAKHGVQLIVVDYLQLMTAESFRGSNREQEIATISRALKSLAKELGVPVIAASQLSRSVEIRGGDKRPILSDLRESGAIEQDADIVVFLYRPEYYGLNDDGMGNPTKGMTEVIIAKHRNGSLDNVSLKFVDRYTKFMQADASPFAPMATNYEVTNTIIKTSRVHDMPPLESLPPLAMLVEDPLEEA
jgi:replicative DNA helicase